MKKKYVLKNKRRFIIVIAIVVSIICSTLIIATTRTKGYSEPRYVSVVVEPGDTLWDIVCGYYGNGVDIRKMISNIRKNNDMDTSELRIGQIIMIPEK